MRKVECRHIYKSPFLSQYIFSCLISMTEVSKNSEWFAILILHEPHLVTALESTKTEPQFTLIFLAITPHFTSSFILPVTYLTFLFVFDSHTTVPMRFPSSLICQWRMTVHYRPQGTCSSRYNEHTAGGHSFHVVSRLPATGTKSTALYMEESVDSVLIIIISKLVHMAHYKAKKTNFWKHTHTTSLGQLEEVRFQRWFTRCECVWWSNLEMETVPDTFGAA